MSAPSMPASRKHPLRLRVAHLNPRSQTRFDLSPDGAARATIAAELGLQGLPRLSFSGHVRSCGQEDWQLEGVLRASVTQSCVITLKPVRSVIEQPVQRIFTPHLRQPDSPDAEMLDDSLEPLGPFIDISAIMIEELMLVLPEYPRAEGAGFAPDQPQAGDDALQDSRKPFAGLDRLLRDRK